MHNSSVFLICCDSLGCQSSDDTACSPAPEDSTVRLELKVLALDGIRQTLTSARLQCELLHAAGHPITSPGLENSRFSQRSEPPSAASPEADSDDPFSSSGLESLGRVTQALSGVHIRDTGQHVPTVKQAKWSPISLWRKEADM